MRLWQKIVVGVGLLLVGSVAAGVIHANIAIARQETREPGEGAAGRMMTVDGRQWHVLTVGEPAADPSGAPVLLVHGFAVAGLETFQPWATSQLGGRSLILPDLLGYGHSERVAAPGPWYSLDSYATGLATLLDQLGAAKVDIVSHSYGAAVSAAFALKYPERVRRIVFMDAGIYVEPSPAEGIVQLPLGIGRAVAWHAFGGGPWSFNTQICQRIGCIWAELAKVRGTTETLRAMMRSHREVGGGDALIRALPTLKVPALVVWGEKDNIVPLAHGERLARETGARLEVIQGAYHLPHLREPEKVGALVRGFLQADGG